MTDKQIIIDGVDVSGCNFTLERDGKIKCECCHATGFGVICDCESWKICDYKNYKRKEQECEELKKYIKHLHNLCGNETDKQYKLKQTLTEIKEIAKKQQSWNEWNRQFSETETEDDIFAYNWSALKQILQKISEVENE